MTSNHLLYQLQMKTIYFNSFYTTKYFLKKSQLGEMLIEQITVYVKFELKRPGPHDHTCTITPKLGIFITKQKSPITTTGNSSSD